MLKTVFSPKRSLCSKLIPVTVSRCWRISCPTWKSGSTNTWPVLNVLKLRWTRPVVPWASIAEKRGVGHAVPQGTRMYSVQAICLGYLTCCRGFWDADVVFFCLITSFSIWVWLITIAPKQTNRWFYTETGPLFDYGPSYLFVCVTFQAFGFVWTYWEHSRIQWTCSSFYPLNNVEHWLFRDYPPFLRKATSILHCFNPCFLCLSWNPPKSPTFLSRLPRFSKSMARDGISLSGTTLAFGGASRCSCQAEPLQPESEPGRNAGGMMWDAVGFTISEWTNMKLMKLI